MVKEEQYLALRKELEQAGVQLVAVSKTQPPEAVLKLYDLGQRVFGENRVQELLEKQPHLPADIQWHLIGHLQTNKVKQVVPHVSMIESLDSVKLCRTVNTEASKLGIIVDALIQIKIATEESKYGFDPETVIEELREADIRNMRAMRVRGVMGIASLIDDENQVRREFQKLHSLYDELKKTLFADRDDFDQISMGMSGDYPLAIREGSTMVRVGSLIFGERQY